MIRLARPEDYPAIYEIYRWYVLHSDAIFDLEPAGPEAFYEMLEGIRKNYPLYAAFYQGELIGYGYTHACFSKEAYAFDVELTIYFRQGPHHGLVKPLYEALEEASRKQNIRWMISCITDTNTQSIALHEKLGFEQTGALPACGLKNGKWLGVVWYCRQLHDPQEYLEKDLRFVPFPERIR